MKKFDLKKYIVADDGTVLRAANNPQLVRALCDSSRFANDEDIMQFMEGFADRYQVQTGNRVRCDGSDNFVEDLQQFGFLKEVD